MGIIRRETRNGVKWEVYVDIKKKRINLGRFDKRRHAELVELMWKPSRSEYFTREQIETAEANGIEYSTLYRRVVKNKWDIEKAITKPVNYQVKQTRKINNVKQTPAYDRVMNYLIKRYVENKAQLQKLFPYYDPKIIDTAWKSGKDMGLCG